MITYLGIEKNVLINKEKLQVNIIHVRWGNKNSNYLFTYMKTV